MPKIRGKLVATKIAAIRVDIQAAAAGIARIDRQLLRLAMLQDVDKNTFNALFVEFVMVAKAD